ncbi:uncharacterized protein Pyn_20835 [Prunus yedoensis var. nudiflora]|uniref:Sacsin n=1 Tax=Prunus yedoensis var. nudiflora TaxID=2094558 RepID=A0A314ZGD1_PRUYE|nr:uncharacterized protein Pyn_20835 [Prunus yedoensis var. nudiflora]
MATPKEHVEEIRKKKFSIGAEAINPLTEDLHQAVKNLSAELYAKDVHFLMELIQKIMSRKGFDPSLEFLITSRDITGTGAPATLLVFNNEKGFSHKNIESICSVGRSTKKGNRKRGYIGEKVYLYGSASALPTTTLILPLKPDKVQAVQQQLSSIHPEVLLFLSKIKRLSVREDNEDLSLNTVSAIEIASETNFVTRKNIDAQSYTLHLSAEESGNVSENECSYYMWKQKFPVKQECRVERRMDADEWVITLAFPIGERLRRGMNTSPGIYAFLPTEMVTNFPFIIQADFLLASSRETILRDNKWNKGILDCVPTAFVNAFISLVRSIKDAPVTSLPRMFEFLPVESSSCEELNVVRESIKAKIVEESIVPSESHKEQKFFYKPREVGRLMPAFWNILRKTGDPRVSLINLSSHGRYVLSYSFDKVEYDHILSFLGVEPVDNEWYAKCIQGTSNLVTGVSEDVYLELLLFIADNWGSKFCRSSIKNISLIKCVGNGNKSLCSISAIQNGQSKVCLSSNYCHVSWLIDWNCEFISVASLIFMPKITQEAIWSCSRKETLVKWLSDQIKVRSKKLLEFLEVHAGASDVPYISAPTDGLSSLSAQLTEKNTFLLLDWIRHLMHQRCQIPQKFLTCIKEGSWLKVTLNGSSDVRPPSQSFLLKSSWGNILQDGSVFVDIPLIDLSYYGEEINSYKDELKKIGVRFEYAEACEYMGKHLMSLASTSTLTRDKVLSVLRFIKFLRDKYLSPDDFICSVKEGQWLKTSLGFRSPVGSVLSDNEWAIASKVSDIPSIDQAFYGGEICKFKTELELLGVVVSISKSYQLIIDNLKSPSCLTSLPAEAVLLMLKCMQLSSSSEKLVKALKGTKCLKTTVGYKSPRNVSCPKLNGAAFCRNELKKTGVIVDFDEAAKVFARYFRQTLKGTPFKLPADLKSCIREVKWLRTRLARAEELGGCCGIQGWGQVCAFLSLSSPEFEQYFSRKCTCFAGLHTYFIGGKDYSFPDVFTKKVSQSWLKAHDGYKPPSSACCLIPRVIVEVDKGCPLIASQLSLHDELSTFVRESQNGEWVNPEECVIYDKDELFGLQLTVLEKYFGPKLLVFFSRAYGVKSCPSIEDYCKLWKVWENFESGLLHDQCCKFWGYVSKHWNSKTEKTLAEALVKLPVNSGSTGILLCNKQDVFIADDLQLQYLFEQSSHQVFVWYPQPSSASLPRTKLLEIYREIGVRTISESVQKEELFLANDVELQLIPTEKLIGKALLRLILGFLACPPIEMEAEKRQKAVQGLANVTVVETSEPITVSYDLPLSSRKILNVRGSQKVRWDREESKISTEKMDRSGGYKSIIEFATYFSEAISEFVLWEIPDHIHALSELMKLAFVLDLDEEAVDFLDEVQEFADVHGG